MLGFPGLHIWDPRYAPPPPSQPPRGGGTRCSDLSKRRYTEIYRTSYSCVTLLSREVLDEGKDSRAKSKSSSVLQMQKGVPIGWDGL